MKKLILFTTCFSFLFTSLWAEDAYSAEPLLVLNISNTGNDLSTESINLFLSGIVSSFAQSGKYLIKNTNYSVSDENTQKLLNRIRTENGQKLTNTEAEIFAGSQYVVIPSIVDYRSEKVDSIVESEVYLSIVFVKLNTGEVISKIMLHTYGIGEDKTEADKEVAMEMTKQLMYKIGQLNKAAFSASIVEIIGNELIIESTMINEISVGDEFYISGSANKSDSGIVAISAKKDDILIGHIIYSNVAVTPGTGLTKKDSIGMEILPYGKVFLGEEGLKGGSVGFRIILSKWVYHIRPYIGMEVPLLPEVFSGEMVGFPVSFIAGGELFWNFNRLQIEPSIGVGFTSLLPKNENESFQISHIGFPVGLTLQWLLLDSFKIYIEGGYSRWIKLSSDYTPEIKNYGGIFIGLGVTFKV